MIIRGRERSSPNSTAVSELNDPEIGGQLIDDHNPLRQHPRPNKGPMDVETSTPSSPQLAGREGRPASPYLRGVCYWIAINLFTLGTPTTLSLISQKSVTTSHIQASIKHAP